MCDIHNLIVVDCNGNGVIGVEGNCESDTN